MLVKDEMKFEQKLNQGDKVLPSKKDAGSRKKRLIALREVRHMLDEVSTRRTILCKENEETRKAIASMRQALTSMPKEIQEARAKLLACDRKSKDTGNVNESIREALYAMNLTISSMPIIVAASTASSLSQQALCATLMNTFQQHPCGQSISSCVPVLSKDADTPTDLSSMIASTKNGFR
jgi:myosin heavy subunit